jgi:uncharacterized membrane protein
MAPPSTDAALERAPDALRGRVHSVDVARGLVMILMVVDHVRVFGGVPAGGTDAATFLTRWITHFCAPVFVFLAGTSVWLGSRSATPAAVSRRLALRGLWLVLLELTLLKACWTFQLDYRSVLAGVIWVIGWSMVLLAGLVLLPWRLVAAFGLLVVLGHDLAGRWSAPAAGTQPGPLHTLLLGIGGFPLGDGLPVVLVLYSLVPWVGVMACGHAFGRVLAARAPACGSGAARSRCSCCCARPASMATRGRSSATAGAPCGSSSSTRRSTPPRWRSC